MGNRTFTGPQEDTTPAIVDFLMRQYRASQGRWLVPDPAGQAAVDITDPQTCGAQPGMRILDQPEESEFWLLSSLTSHRQVPCDFP